MSEYTASIALGVTQSAAFEYHDRPGALARLVPPWKKVWVESTDNSLQPGSRVTLKTSIGPIPLRWLAEHTQYDPPNLFADKQISGPFAKWEHQHHFSSGSSLSCVLRDQVHYQIPMGALGNLLGGWLVRKELETMFAYRHRVTRDDLQMSQAYQADPMKIAVSGASGLVGKKLSTVLALLGHNVYRLERSIEKAEGDARAIAPWASEEEASKLNGFDAVIHLAGKSIADSKWTPQHKQQIRDSRVELTEKLARSLAALDQEPSVFVCASAIGIYGDRGDEVLSEESKPDDSFLAEVGVEWENACEPARNAGIRVANARLGIVLDPGGGALKQMLTPAKLMGGSLGNGKQWWSWVALDDVIGAIYHAICTPEVQGAFNVTAPEPMRNVDFARTLGRVLGRPALFPAPAFALRLALGEMADALLLASARVTPERLQRTGYEFRFAELDSALRYCLGRDRLESTQ